MNKKKIPKTLIKKDGTISPEMEYNKLNAIEMLLGAIEYFLENDPETPEEGLEHIKLGNELMALSDYQINPESRHGILLGRVNDLKSAKIQEKLDELESKARRDIESGLLQEEIQHHVNDLNAEIEKNGRDNDSE